MQKDLKIKLQDQYDAMWKLTTKEKIEMCFYLVFIVAVIFSITAGVYFQI